MKTAKEINARRERFLTAWYSELCLETERLQESIEEWWGIWSEAFVRGEESEMHRAEVGAAMDRAELKVLDEDLEFVESRLESLETA